MKINKSIFFSIFFLASFLVSFGVNTFQSFGFRKVEKISVTNKLVFSNFHSDEANVSDFLFEENENEEDDDINATLSFFPYILNTAFSQKPIIPYFRNHSKSKKNHTPMYLSVGNFRI
jgi:hypothetical protein